MYFNKVMLMGRTTGKPVVETTKKGTPVAKFSVAINRPYKVGDEWKEEAHFFNVVIFGNYATTISERIDKGDEVLIEGELVQSRWTDKEGNNRSAVSIKVYKVMLNRKKGQGYKSPESIENETDDGIGEIPSIEDIDEDVPF